MWTKNDKIRSTSPKAVFSLREGELIWAYSKTDSAMKQRGTYKKKPRPNGMPHSLRERPRDKVDEQIFAMERLTRQGARVYWGSETRPDGSSPSKFVRDKTWGMTFQHFSQVDTDFSIKAGSKKMLLTSAPTMSTSDPSKVIKISESWLHRKYR